MTIRPTGRSSPRLASSPRQWQPLIRICMSFRVLLVVWVKDPVGRRLGRNHLTAEIMNPLPLPIHWKRFNEVAGSWCMNPIRGMCPEVRGKRTAPSTRSSGYQITRQPPRVREPRSDVGSRRFSRGTKRSFSSTLLRRWPGSDRVQNLHRGEDEFAGLQLPWLSARQYAIFFFADHNPD